MFSLGQIRKKNGSKIQKVEWAKKLKIGRSKIPVKADRKPGFESKYLSLFLFFCFLVFFYSWLLVLKLKESDSLEAP